VHGGEQFTNLMFDCSFKEQDQQILNLVTMVMKSFIQLLKFVNLRRIKANRRTSQINTDQHRSAVLSPISAEPVFTGA
jgi:hypothetical protein